MLLRDVLGLLRALPVLAIMAAAQPAWSALPQWQQQTASVETAPVRIVTAEQASQSAPTPTSPTEPISQTDDGDGGPDRHQIECIAKVIVHEAGNQPLQGRVAVAQVIRNRVRAGFGSDACAVVKQHGQFFDVDAYNPARSGTGWSEAVAIAARTLSGGDDEVAPGALFFHASYAAMPTRVQVARIGDHVFYR